jgi:hypothetical protein
MLASLASALTLLLLSSPVFGADINASVQVHTIDDDLRAGSAAWVVLRMTDGKEQLIALTGNGERLADDTRKNVRVAPSGKYNWGDVDQVGIRFRPNRGSGTTRADDWHMRYSLGVAGCPAPGSPPPQTLCVSVNGAGAFEGDRGEQTIWAPVRLSGNQCSRDVECDADALFCNDLAYECRAAANNFRVKVCARLATPVKACGGGACTEAEKRCGAAGCRDDKDGDGRISVACGGDDCDDTDRRRYPGNPEVCDNNGLDEDCNFSTIGDRDADGDGFVDARCWNDVTQRSNRSVPGRPKN